MIGNINDETNFPHELLTDRQASNLRKAFANNPSDNIKLTKTKSSKITKSGGFLVRLPGPLLKTDLPIMNDVLKSLAKSVLILIGLTAAVSATGTWVQKKIFVSGTTTLVFSNKEMEDIMKIVKSLEESCC